MKRTHRKVMAVALFLGTALVAPIHAQSSGGQFSIDKVAIAGGGGPIAGGSYQITSTLGQAATATLGAAGYMLFSGFWGPLPGFVNNMLFASGFEL